MGIIRTRPGLLRRRLSTLFLIVCVLALILFIGTAMRDWLYSPSITGNAALMEQLASAASGMGHRKFRHRQFKDDSAEEVDVQVCKVPLLTLEGDVNKFAFQDLRPLRCKGENLFYVRNTMLTINETVLRNRKIDHCGYERISFLTDDQYSLSDQVVKRKAPFELKIKDDFFRVECYLAKEGEKVEQHQQRRLLNSDRLEAQSKLQDPPGVVVGGVLPDMPVMNNMQYQQPNNQNKPVGQVADSPKIEHIPAEKQEVMEQAAAQQEQEQNQEQEQDQEQEDPDYRYPNAPIDSQYYNTELPDFEQYIAQIYPTEDILERVKSAKPNPHSTQMNILIFALDSMSHLSYQRKLPKTYAYLQDTLESFILNAYNIVGDATTAALIPLLTGKTEQDLPEVRRGFEDAHFVDAYPFIWNKMEQSGYVTLYAEDQPTLGTFQLRFHGFEQMPVDHYMRPFWQSSLQSLLYKNSEYYCLGGTPLHRITLDYIKDFFLRYPETPKFGMGFLGELSHADNNPAQYIDEDLVELLEFLQKNNFLDNTLLIVMGDHGARYSKVRQSVQGKLEERLPMMSLRFPQWFRDQHPDIVLNLHKNVNRLSTPFDIHETMKDLLDMSRLDRKPGADGKVPRGQSLLREIPRNRTCAAAGVDMHWCSCLQYEEIDPSDPMSKQGAAFLLEQLNGKTQNFRELCRELSLKQIVDSKLVVPNSALLKYRWSQDSDHRIANFSEKIQVDMVYYQLIIRTAPNDGLYESTLQYNLHKKEWTMTADVSRINMYHDEPHCITKSRPSIMKYCYCHKQLLPQKKRNGSEF